MDAYHTDDELEKLKAWWKNYGNSVVAGIALGAILLGGFSYWKHYKNERAVRASMLYDTLIENVGQNRSDAARDAAGKLMADYAATPYAGKAALVLAKINFDAADIEAARKPLQWAVEHATEDATRHAARLRLARLLIDQGALDQALTLASVKDTDGFESDYQELRGDLYAAKSRKTDARNAYRLALASLPRGSSYTRVLKMKLDDLGPEPSSPGQEVHK